MKDIFYPYYLLLSRAYELIPTVTNQCFLLYKHDHGVEGRRLLMLLRVSLQL